MTNRIAAHGRFSLGELLDYFIPAEIQVNPGAHRRARMFMLSHLFGPILGSSLPAYLYAMDISRDYRVGIFFALVMNFWIYPPLLRWTGRYQLISFISVQNLIFCVFWAVYAYGGFLSPFMPWMLIFPLLAFLYLPTTGRVKNMLIAQIFGNVAGFFAFLLSKPHLPAVDLTSLQTIGMISMASVAIYFAMMSTYFARMFDEQDKFSREMASLLSSTENVQQLTAAARQASVAKANFVASMSHELRTPLNSIIGYSQLLVDEAIDESDDESVSDLKKINKAGTHLLRLIDDILDYSRIDAGKMPITVSGGTVANAIPLWTGAIRGRLALTDVEVDAHVDSGRDEPIATDWALLGNAIRMLSVASVGDERDGRLEIDASVAETGNRRFDVTFVNGRGEVAMPTLPSESFEHDLDSSATKYGSTGIESTLALRFATLIGADISVARDKAGRPCLRLELTLATDAAQAA